MPVALEYEISCIEMNRQRAAPKCDWTAVEYVTNASTTRIQNILPRVESSKHRAQCNRTAVDFVRKLPGDWRDTACRAAEHYFGC